MSDEKKTFTVPQKEVLDVGTTIVFISDELRARFGCEIVTKPDPDTPKDSDK